MITLPRKMPFAASLSELNGPQERLLAVSFSTLSLGTGLSTTLLALYLTRFIHVSAAAYGAGMSVAAIFGIVSGPVMGQLADRINSYRLYAALVWAMSFAMAAMTVASKWLALALLSVLLACGRGGAAVMGSLIGRALTPDRRVRYRAVVKSLSTVTMVIGMGLGGLVLAVGFKGAFQSGFVAEALTLVLAGVLVWRACPRGEVVLAGDSPQVTKSKHRQATRTGLAAIRDVRFAAIIAINSVLMLYTPLLTVALPLWVAARMHASLLLVSVALVVSSVGVVLLQVPASRQVSGLRTAATAARKGGVLFGVAAATFPLAAAVHGDIIQLAVIVVLALALAGGEVLYSVGSWELVYCLSPEESLGQYQGLFNIGMDVSLIVAPTLFGLLTVVRSMLGWAIVSFVFVLAAVLIVPLSTRSYGTRMTAEPVTVGKPAQSDGD